MATGFVFFVGARADIVMQGDPSDGGGQPKKIQHVTHGVSFRDMVTGNKQPPLRSKRTNLFEKNLA